ncbi:FAD-dependent oxidoreductase [Reyranella soli]|jgi:glycine/D-amino acid oxidase-like deaminating enzyme|uniref:FAD-dependent oxidoreductase n=1 Tax=Reyranella soli TaxID=1230389 RepID=A0A512NIS1_9HYPH|nr:FAD-dependent oxidoreductase [Reyranella soli]
MVRGVPLKVIVVGAGIAGLTLAWALSRRGHAVSVYEQGPIPNPIASSFDEHRTTRHAYGSMTGYANLMPKAFQIWETLFRDLGRRHYEPVGIVYFMRGGTPWLEPSLASLNQLAVPYKEVPIADVPGRFPMINPEGLTHVLETEGAGMLFPNRIMSDLIVLLSQRGVGLHAYSKVDSVDPDRATITVGGETIGADVVAVTAGPWVDRLIPMLKRMVTPSRQAVAYLAPPPELAEAWSRAPVIADLSEESRCYALPPRFGTRMKVGNHNFTREGDPDAPRLASDDDLEPVRRSVRRAFLGFERYAELERKACYYTVEDKEQFVVRPIGASGWVVSACSGHGFKLQPLITDGLARAIVGECDADTVTGWAAGRSNVDLGEVTR